MSNIDWENASHKGSWPITRETWDTETIKVNREAKIQLQTLISEGLREEDKPLKEDTHFTMTAIPKRDSDELKGTNPDDLASSQIPKDEGTPKGQIEIYITSQDPRKIGKHAPFFISLLVNELILHNCMLDSGASMNIIPLRVMEKLVLEISQPYQNVCAVDSQPITVCGLINVNFCSLKKVFSHGPRSWECGNRHGHHITLLVWWKPPWIWVGDSWFWWWDLWACVGASHPQGKPNFDVDLWRGLYVDP
jgi:hypothetical protein